MHLFLSPHLDDAILSCGGLIHHLILRGESVLLRSFMTGDPPHPLPDTPLVRDLHRRWAAGENPYQQRRAEDRKAAQSLGADVQHLGWLDCPYRTSPSGEPLYVHNDDLFGAVHPDDPLLREKITLPADAEKIYAPLGAGGHVDHKVIVQLVNKLRSQTALYFYEEYPYSASSGEAARVTYHSGVQKVGAEAVQAALAAFDAPLQPFLIPLDDENLVAKIAAIGCYESQISSFWDDKADMAACVRRYAQEVAPEQPIGAERLWTVERQE